MEKRNNNTQWVEISDFEGEEFYGFAMIPNKRKENPGIFKKGNGS